MQFKSITTYIDGQLVHVELPTTNCCVLTGDERKVEGVLCAVRSIVSCDYVGDLNDYHIPNPTFFDGKSSLNFTQGTMFVDSKAVCKEGSIPKLHLIDGKATGNIDTSLLYSSFENMITDNFVASLHYFTEEQRADIQKRFNRFAGCDCLDVSVTPPKFALETVESWKALQMAYLLLTESYTTPEDYLRIMLIHKNYYLQGDKLVEFMDILKGVRGLEMLLCAVDTETAKNLKDIEVREII